MSLGQHAALNLAGASIPLLAAIPAFAVLARTLAPEPFSLLTLALTLVGFAGVLDMGLSRSLVRVISRERASPEKLASILRTALAMATVLGVTASGSLYLCREVLIHDVLKVTSSATLDAVSGFGIVALTIPLLLPALIVQGYWDGREDFVESNIQRLVSGILIPLFTSAAAVLSPTFTSTMVGLLAARVVTLGLSLHRRRLWQSVVRGQVGRGQVRELLHFGGWVTVSNLVSPIMGSLDRYLLGFTNSASVVAYYSVPVDAAIKLLVMPAAVTRGLFPKLAVKELGKIKYVALTKQAYLIIGVTCLPLAVLVAAYAELILTAWLGRDYGIHSAGALQILMVGFLFCAFAQIPFTEIHARGRADLAAKIHLGEVVPFLMGAFYLTSTYGVTGAAIAWTLRNALDFVLLALCARSLKL